MESLLNLLCQTLWVTTGRPTDRMTAVLKQQRNAWLLFSVQLQTLPRPLSADDGYFNYYRGVPLAIWLQKWSLDSSGQSISSVNQTVLYYLVLTVFPNKSRREEALCVHDKACWESIYIWVMGLRQMHKKQDILRECELGRRSTSGKTSEISVTVHLLKSLDFEMFFKNLSFSPRLHLFDQL